jgi:hypothetical protein
MRLLPGTELTIGPEGDVDWPGEFLQLACLRYGIGTAQRGWLTPDDVINTWPLRRLRRFLRKHGAG